MQVTDFLAIRPIAKSWLDQESCLQFSHLNPLWNSVLSDSGQLLNGYYDLIFGVSGDANHFYFELQHRNGANAATVERFTFSVAAFVPAVLYLESHYLAHHERFRIVPINNTAGNFIAGLLWYRRSYEP